MTSNCPVYGPHVLIGYVGMAPLRGRLSVQDGAGDQRLQPRGEPAADGVCQLARLQWRDARHPGTNGTNGTNPMAANRGPEGSRPLVPGGMYGEILKFGAMIVDALVAPGQRPLLCESMLIEEAST